MKKNNYNNPMLKKSNTINHDYIKLNDLKKKYTNLKNENILLKNKKNSKFAILNKINDDFQNVLKKYKKLKEQKNVIKLDKDVLMNCFDINIYENELNAHEEDMMNKAMQESLKENPEYNDNLTYEELIDLQDKVGKVSKGLKKSQKYLLNKIKNTKFNLKCPICIEDIELNKYMYKLNCNHYFHIDCVDKWFEEEKVCPICKKEVK